MFLRLEPSEVVGLSAYTDYDGNDLHRFTQGTFGTRYMARAVLSVMPALKCNSAMYERILPTLSRPEGSSTLHPNITITVPVDHHSVRLSDTVRCALLGITGSQVVLPEIVTCGFITRTPDFSVSALKGINKASIPETRDRYALAKYLSESSIKFIERLSLAGCATHIVMPANKLAHVGGSYVSGRHADVDSGASFHRNETSQHPSHVRASFSGGEGVQVSTCGVRREYINTSNMLSLHMLKSASTRALYPYATHCIVTFGLISSFRSDMSSRTSAPLQGCVVIYRVRKTRLEVSRVLIVSAAQGTGHTRIAAKDATLVLNSKITCVWEEDPQRMPVETAPGAMAAVRYYADMAGVNPDDVEDYLKLLPGIASEGFWGHATDPYSDLQ